MQFFILVTTARINASFTMLSLDRHVILFIPLIQSNHHLKKLAFLKDAPCLESPSLLDTTGLAESPQNKRAEISLQPQRVTLICRKECIESMTELLQDRQAIHSLKAQPEINPLPHIQSQYRLPVNFRLRGIATLRSLGSGILEASQTLSLITPSAHVFSTPVMRLQPIHGNQIRRERMRFDILYAFLASTDVLAKRTGTTTDVIVPSCV